jgi:AraC-like DNA-binding protein
MAADYGSSRSHFYRCFQQYAGQSPQAFVIEARLRMARVLLHDSGNDIGWIAEHLGYSDVYFFSRQFKQHHGCSPSEFRRNHGSQARRRRNAG